MRPIHTLRKAIDHTKHQVWDELSDQVRTNIRNKSWYVVWQHVTDRTATSRDFKRTINNKKIWTEVK